MNLDAFIKEERMRLRLFEIFWRREHNNNPVMYPMEMPLGNEGLWYEQFATFDPWDELYGMVEDARAMNNAPASVMIRGVDVTLDELAADVEAAKGKGLSGLWAFTPETVEALVNVLKEQM